MTLKRQRRNIENYDDDFVVPVYSRPIYPKSTYRFRRNPDSSGNAWGPSLYNPLNDIDHPFKDESHYQKMISKLRRNPFKRGTISNQFYF